MISMTGKQIIIEEIEMKQYRKGKTKRKYENTKREKSDHERIKGKRSNDSNEFIEENG